VTSEKALEMLADAGAWLEGSGNFAVMAEVGPQAAALPRSGDRIEELLTDLLVGAKGLSKVKDADGIPIIVGGSAARVSLTIHAS
jgi:hypothetical protein